MEGMNKFQLGFLLLFGFFILIGVGIFAVGGISSNRQPVAKATLWGTIDQKVFEKAFAESSLAQDKTIQLTYIEKNPATFDQEFVEALASGVGPDLVLVTNKTLARNESKLYPIPYENYSARDFRSNFAEIGEVFLSGRGIFALPIAVDPLVMYWNRDIFTSARIALPPTLWSEFYDLSIALTKKDSALNVTQSVASLGEFANVSNATDLVSVLLMQAGTAITSRHPQDDTVQSVLKTPPLAADQALTFYTEFSNPLRPYYAWNRSLPVSKNFFLSGNLALYFGFASELTELRLKNPNLNFDVAPVPQSKDAPRVTTVGTVTGVAIVRNTQNVVGAYRVATALSGPSFVQTLATNTLLPPARRDLLAVKQSQAFTAVFYAAGLQARTWLWPDAQKTSAIFKEMIEGVTGGRRSVSDAVNQAAVSLES